MPCEVKSDSKLVRLAACLSRGQVGACLMASPSGMIFPLFDIPLALSDSMPTLEQLLETFRRIEALHSRTDVDGEKAAAAEAMHRIRKLLAEKQTVDPPVEFRFSMEDDWSRKLFVALLRRYGLAPYRYPRQRYTTVMVRAPTSFVNETLWPEFLQLSDVLRQHLNEITERVINSALQGDTSEAAVVAGNPGLPEPRR